jgi:protoporphyrinogen oxidase
VTPPRLLCLGVPALITYDSKAESEELESMEAPKSVIVIGAGVTGLVAAYELIKRGFRVTVVESSDRLGGLAGSFFLGLTPAEKYYHFICRGDDDLIDLIHELGIESALHWRQASTTSFIRGRMFKLNTPFDLLKFSPVPFSQRLRFGLNALISQHRKHWHELDRISAKEWLIDQVGPEAYAAIWDPLLRIKFGTFQEDISAAWIWHRIHRVSRSRDGLFGGCRYGYLEKGCFTLVEALKSRLAGSDSFQLLMGTPVARIAVNNSRAEGVITAPTNKFVAGDFVISTIALPILEELVSLAGEYGERLRQIEYLNIVCMLMQLERPLSEEFWTNVNDPRIAFNGIIELTNLNPRSDLGGTHLVYIPFYVYRTDPRWRFSDAQLYEECSEALGIIHPHFGDHLVKNWLVSRDHYAQAICSVGFLNIMPGHETPVENLFITDSSQYYPEDRTISAAVRLGRQVASLITRDDLKKTK